MRRVLRICHELGVPVVARGAGTGLSGGALPHARRRAAVAGEVQAHPARSIRWRALARGAAGRAQPRHLRGGGALRPVLRARSRLADRLHHRRQRRRELGRRALPQVRPHGAQRAARARRSPSTGEAGRVRLRGARCAGLRPAGAGASAPRACSRSSPRSRSSCCPSRRPAQVVMASLRRRREGRRRGGRDHRRRHHSRRPGDDGPAGHARGRAVRARRLRPRCGGDPAVRVRRHAGGSRGGDRAR